MDWSSTVAAINIDTVNHISSKLQELHVSDSEFSRVCGFRSKAFSDIARFDRPLSFAFLCAASTYYGFDVVGDRWNPYPDKWKFLPYSYDTICENIRENVSAYKDMLPTRGKSFYQFYKDNCLYSYNINRILRSSGKIYLPTVIKLACAMKLDKISYIYMDSNDFLFNVLPKLEV